MTALKLGETLFVVDKIDGKTRKCKVKAVDDNNQLIQIHFVGFNSRYDEWIEITSDRIVENDDGDELYEPDDEIKVALGELAAIDEVTAKIIPCFSHDIEMTTRKLNVLPVSTIHECAESMNISTRSVDDKKLNKLQIIKLIISKIKSFLPNVVYAVKFLG